MTIRPLHELTERYQHDALSANEAYELGRVDGYVDAEAHVESEPHRALRVLGTLRDQVLYAFAHCGRPTRAYTLGYARGYREMAR